MRLAFAARRSPAAPYSPLLPRGTLLRRGDALKLATCPTIPPANISSAPGSSLRRCARKFPPALTIDFTGYFGSLPSQPTQGPSVTFLRGRWQNNNKKGAAPRRTRPKEIQAPRQREPAKVVSLMDALRRSVDARARWRW